MTDKPRHSGKLTVTAIGAMKYNDSSSKNKIFMSSQTRRTDRSVVHTFTAPAAELEKLRHSARKEGVTMSVFVRQAVAERIAKLENPKI